MGLFVLALIIPNIVLDITESYGILSKITNIVLPAGLYILLAFSTRKAGLNLLLGFPVMFFAAFQIVLLFLYGESIIAVDMFMNVMTTNVSEATELLSNLLPAILVVCIIYLPFIITGIIYLCKHKTFSVSLLRRGRVTGAIVSATGIVLLIITVFCIKSYSPRTELFPYNVCANLVESIKRQKESLNYPQTSRNFTYEVEKKSDSIPEVYVLVIGETSRADNWQLCGYDRPTNPMLSKRNDIVFYPYAVSESNTTHKSVPLMLSPLTAETFSDSINCVKSIITAFKESGFKTAYLSNQQRNHSYIDYFGSEADTTIFLKDNSSQHFDHELIIPMTEIIQSNLQQGNKKQFIVLHTYGSHFDYKDRITKEYQAFTPCEDYQADAESRDLLINAYDNTVVYTDGLLNSIIENLKELHVNSAMLYTSDHGEDIFDDERHRFLHASPVPTYYQLHVPFLLWMSEDYLDEHPGILDISKSNAMKPVSSSQAIYHTLEEIAGLKTQYTDTDASVINNRYKAKPFMYLTDLNKGVPLKESGLKTPDFIQFKKHNITIE